MRVAHLADLHWSQSRLDEKIRCGEILLRELEERRPDFIVVAGDSFDRTVRLEEPAAFSAIEWFTRARKIARVIVIKGNFSHDRNSIEPLRWVGEGITVSTEPEIYTAGWNADVGPKQTEWTLNHLPLAEVAKQTSEIDSHAVFFTLPYPSQAFLAQAARRSPGEMREAVSAAIRDVIRGFAAVPVRAGTPRILVFHGTVSGAMMTESQHAMGMDIELTLGDLRECRFDLVCAGHLHYAQQFGETVFYPGGSTHTSYGDDGRKGMWIHDVVSYRFNDAKMETTSADPVKITSTHVGVAAIPMRTVSLNFSDPFFELPEWSRTEEADVQIRVKLQESDRERYAGTDWKALFPKARTIDLVPEVEAVISIRCEEVRQARTLREKVVVWGNHHLTQTGTSILTDTLLSKADQLEAIEAEAVIAEYKGGLCR